MSLPPSTEAQPVVLRVGSLDHISCRELRAVLRASRTDPYRRLVVDLRRMDDDHDMTLFALLAESSRSAAGAPTPITVLQPSNRLAPLLVAVGLTVSRDPADVDSSAGEKVDVGVFA